MEDSIEIVNYDPAWPEQFARERALLVETLGLASDCFQHVGSTAVKGLAAKPTIDVMIGAEPLDVGPAQVTAMERAGYSYLGEFGIPGRHFFKKGEPRTHHVHWVRRDADFWKKQLAFRDYLRACPEACGPYARLKRELAVKFEHDRAAYTKGKTGLISLLQEQAWRWAGASTLILDLEATCWEGGQPPDRMETIEIGAVRLDAKLQPVDEFSIFVRPKHERRLSAFCTELTSIKQADIDAAGDFPSALKAFAAWAGTGPYRLASWSAYDLAQLKGDCARTGVVLPAGLECHLDLRERYASLRGIPPCGMSEALEREGLKVQGRLHRGIDDARNEARLARLILATESVG